MSRPREFDEDQVVAAAIACFRERGFDATSIRHLEAATGLKAPSLYQAFGNKASLFAAALSRYHRDVLDRRIAQHLQPKRGLAGVRAFFSSTYATEPFPEHGCLLANSSVEYSAIDDEARALVTSGLSKVRVALTAALEDAQRTGAVASWVDPDRAAQTLLVFYQGLLLLLRTRQRAVDLDAAIDGALEPLAAGARS